MPPPDPSPTADAAGWHLEVVRGVQPGATYPLDGAEVDLGNAPSGTPGLVSLLEQEGPSPRRMVARHAALIPHGGSGWAVRDRDTPGGTFVNNRRVLPGVAQPLAAGDVLQLGSVQVRLVRSGAAVRPNPTPAPPPSAPFASPFRSSGSGMTCRTWDDFLPLAAQHWDELRSDLEAGHLAEFAASVGRPDLAPAPPRPGETPDERLDTWLGCLPTRTPALPELDVHPLQIVVTVPSGGVTLRRRVRISNVGHRLLRATVAVAPGAGSPLSLPPEVAGQALVIRDSVEVAFEVAAPDPLDEPVTGELVIAGAGSTCRVAVRVERRAPTAPIEGVNASPGQADAGEPAAPEALATALRAWRGLTVGRRLVLGALVGPLLRLQVGVLGGSLGDSGLVASGPEVPSLGLEAVGLAALGAILGGLAGRRPGGGVADSGWSAVGGAGLGMGLALVLVATCRAVEPILGPLAGSILVILGLWAVLGMGLALSLGRLDSSSATLEEAPR